MGVSILWPLSSAAIAVVLWLLGMYWLAVVAGAVSVAVPVGIIAWNIKASKRGRP
jgi:hypothetical protein